MYPFIGRLFRGLSNRALDILDASQNDSTLESRPSNLIERIRYRGMYEIGCTKNHRHLQMLQCRQKEL